MKVILVVLMLCFLFCASVQLVLSNDIAEVMAAKQRLGIA